MRYEAQFNGDPKNPIANPDGTIGSVRQAPDNDLRPIPQTIKSDLNNLGPRLGISWDPMGDGKTVDSRRRGNLLRAHRDDLHARGGRRFPRQHRLLFCPRRRARRFPRLPRASSPVTPGLVSSVNFVSEDFQNLRVLNMNIGVEREVIPESLGWRRLHLLPDRERERIGGFNTTFDQNTFPPPARTSTGGPSASTSFTRGRPSSTVFQADMLSSLGRARYKAITVKLKKGFTDRAQFLAHYTWSKDESNADAERDIGFTMGPSNAFDLESDFGIDERRHHHTASSSRERRRSGRASPERARDLPFGSPHPRLRKRRHRR